MSKALIEAAASYFGMDPARLNMDTSTMTVGAGSALRFTFSVQVTDDDYLGVCKRMAEMRKSNMDENLDKFLGIPRKEGPAAPSNWSKQPEPTMGMVYAAVTRIEKSIQDAIDAAQPMTEDEQPAPEQEQDQPAFVPLPSLEQVIADPVKYMDRSDCDGLLQRACDLSRVARHKYDVEWERRYHAQNQSTPTVRVDKAPAEPEHSRDTGNDEPANRLQAKAAMISAAWVPESDVTKDQEVEARGMATSENGERQYLLPIKMLTDAQRTNLLQGAYEKLSIKGQP